MENIINFDVSFNRKLIFGKNELWQIPKILREYGKNFLFILSKSFSLSDLWKSLESELIEEFLIYTESVTGEPTVDLIDKLVRKYINLPVDAIVSIGGGSAIDTGKSLSSLLIDGGSVKEYLEGIGNKKLSGKKAKFIAIPTTAGTGSEATKNAVISEIGKNGFKKSIRHENLIPDVAILDPYLLKSLPKHVRIPSGFDALSQLIESYTSLKSNVITDTLCEKAFLMIGASLEKFLFNDSDEDSDLVNLSLSAYISGLALANAGLGAVHGFASVIGGYFSIPHGVICANLLYPTTIKNIEILKKGNDAFFKKFARIGNLLYGDTIENTNEGIDRLKEFLEKNLSKANLKKLSSYGVTRDDIPRIIEKTSIKENPAKLQKEDLEEILEMSL
jgi:alcohol dehydrogenase class IV